MANVVEVLRSVLTAVIQQDLLATRMLVQKGRHIIHFVVYDEQRLTLAVGAGNFVPRVLFAHPFGGIFTIRGNSEIRKIGFSLVRRGMKNSTFNAMKEIRVLSFVVHPVDRCSDCWMRVLSAKETPEMEELEFLQSIKSLDNM